MPEQAKIFPRVPRVLSVADLSNEEKSEWYYGCLGFLIWVASCVLSFIVLNKTNLVSHTHWLVWLSPFVVATAITVGMLHELRTRRGSQLVVVKNNALREQSEREAENQTRSAHACYQQSFAIVKQLGTDVWLVDEALRKARSEFSANAFSPFWDMIEKALTHIVDFEQHLHTLLYNGREYEQLLRDRQHNFPQYPINNAMLPDLRKAVRELHETVRLGQTNYHFASIWEHRRTREVMVAGFKNLGDAVQRIGPSVDQSLADFEQRLRDLFRNR